MTPADVESVPAYRICRRCGAWAWRNDGLCHACAVEHFDPAAPPGSGWLVPTSGGVAHLFVADDSAPGNARHLRSVCRALRRGAVYSPPSLIDVPWRRCANCRRWEASRDGPPKGDR